VLRPDDPGGQRERGLRDERQIPSVWVRPSRLGAGRVP
jgi:hypothetical protein